MERERKSARENIIFIVHYFHHYFIGALLSWLHKIMQFMLKILFQPVLWGECCGLIYNCLCVASFEFDVILYRNSFNEISSFIFKSFHILNAYLRQNKILVKNFHHRITKL